MGITVDHLSRVTEEFGRQAETFDSWAQQTDDQAAMRFQKALDKAASGALLDVACGPGIITAALAPQAASVVAFDATEQMLEKAKVRCAKAGLQNVEFRQGDAEKLPFDDARFDGVVTRLAIHHFAAPQRALQEMFRVLRPGGTAVIVDIVSSEDAAESNLHNAIERLRDPSHTRMLPASELERSISQAGFQDLDASTWDQPREFEEWARIVNDPMRTDPIRTVIHTLAEDDRTAGIGLSIKDEQIVFVHRWRLVRAIKPMDGSARDINAPPASNVT